MNAYLADTGTEPTTIEYNLLIDGVVECPAPIESKLFFDGLLDTIIDYVEKREAVAGRALPAQTCPQA